ncbi:hypothetical protein BGV55_27310 [Burkholderia ubonensis]|uniref:hypothetical protein n=1 Tax=Burkholderia ubonensis TaxID=101571 RepID=UPI0008FDCEC5|nr:hypothetical protein [Burkholderia ubonensis]OJB21881.1 hypothetical protein BGV55_27310 [Burkholderia ubonensis]
MKKTARRQLSRVFCMFRGGRKDLSVILWARHIMRVKNHGYADEEEETNGGLAGSGPRAAA